MIRLSILIPVYNAAAYLPACVESLFRQDLPEADFEVCLIDDGSTDESPAVMRRLAAEHPSVRLFTQANQGVSAARNRGIREAEGEYLLFVDADDAVMPRSLAPLLRAAQAQQADIAKGLGRKADSCDMDRWLKEEEDAAPAKEATGPTDITLMTGEEAYCRIYSPLECTVWQYLYRTEFLRSRRIQFLPSIRMAEDMEVVERCLLQARRVIALPIPFYLYRQHDGSCVSTMTAGKLCDMNTVLGVIAREHTALPLQAATRQRQAQNFHHHLMVVVWYLSHHRSLYAERRRVMGDLLAKVSRFPGGLPLRQRLSLWTVRHFPLVYTALRTALPGRKFD
jgi:glycosyltransferase involved in cell wall biosynthesis